MSQENLAQPIQSLLIGLGEDLKGFVASALQKVMTKEIPCDLDQLMSLEETFQPTLILCGAPPPQVTFTELAQMLRMQYPESSIFLVVHSYEKFDRKNVKKNGFTDIFFIPTDLTVMTDEVTAIQDRASGKKTVYRSVKIIDIAADDVLDFDTFLYLPANNKHIKYTAAGQPLDNRKIQKLKTSSVTSLYVPENDINKFYDYTAKKLVSLGSDPSLSQTERSQRLKYAVRDIVTSLFSDTVTGTDGGKQIVKDCQNIIQNYVMATNPDSLLKRISSIVGETGDAYTHYSNVSTFATLFAIGLGVTHIEEIALAGLLHDIGLSRIPAEIQNKPEHLRTKEEQSAYEKHVEYSIDLIKERKLVVPDMLYKIVLQHHERFDGQGYPNKISGNKFGVEAQIVAFADLFDEMTALSSGRVRISPMEAVAELKATLSNPSQCRFDPKILKQILGLFPSTVSEWETAVA